MSGAIAARAARIYAAWRAADGDSSTPLVARSIVAATIVQGEIDLLEQDLAVAVDVAAQRGQLLESVREFRKQDL